MTFSGALTLTDLNDFITPSQACIKPVEQLNAPEIVKEAGSASTEIRVDASGSYYEVASTPSVQGAFASTSTPPERKLQQAQISLNDCLACSGCITSAESVLITLQSHTEVLHFLEGNSPPRSPGHKLPVISIAPQSLASLSTTLSSSSSAPVGLKQVMRRVTAFCTQVLGFEHVYDTTFARHISLLEHVREFWERKRDGKLPMLASACPGWVCYAEKTHSEMLPFISRTKSPQQVMGTLVKSWLASRWGKQPDQMYHVAVMPCYDKKLEASRQDFYNDVYSTRDVDCVITTGELELLMHEKGWDLSLPVPGEDDAPKLEEMPELLHHPGTSSGSYLQWLMSAVRQASSEPLDVSMKTIRTSDYEEYTLYKQSNGEVVFKGAKCYGFRNLQNVVRKVGKEAGVQVGRGAAGRMAGVRMRAKKGGNVDEKGYDYVEVMACPGGCVNGGGQLGPIGKVAARTEDEEGYERSWEANGVSMSAGETGTSISQGPKWGNREWTKEVEKAYWNGLAMPGGSGVVGSDEMDHVAVGVLVDMCRPVEAGRRGWGDDMDSGAEARRRELFRTQYRAVVSEVIGLAVKW
ncbi:iron hydrogenase [Chiua virens]|nr:iron hydrogenase [Chiua virens]